MHYALVKDPSLSHGGDGSNMDKEDVEEGNSWEEATIQAVDTDEPKWLRFVAKAALLIAAFLLVSILVEKFAEKEVSKFAKTLMDSIGLPGIFALVFFFDGFPQPFTYVPLIYMAIKGSMPKTSVFMVCALASYTAAISGYWAGNGLSRVECANGMFEYVEKNYPMVPDLMKRKGNTGVCLAALLPVPLAIATWTAGSFRIPFHYFCFAAMCRAPKILVFVLLSRGPSVTSGAA